MTRDALLQEALKFVLTERTDEAAELLASRDEKPAESLEKVEKAWAAEIERRARRVLAGESAGVPWEKLKQRIEGRLAQQRCRPSVHRRRASLITPDILLQ